MIRAEVLDVMKPYLENSYGNPSSLYSFGRDAKNAIDKSRKQIANAIGCNSSEIYFTGSGTEANNWALKSYDEANINKGNHIIISSIEHKSILCTCLYLKEKGFEITYVEPDKNGYISVESIEKEIKPTTILISIMMVNNEIGIIQPIKEIGNICRNKGIVFHSDAIQALGHLPINVNDLSVDMISLSAHKVHAPKGIGALYVKNGTNINPFIHGGKQENNMRAGTENVPYIVGFGVASELTNKELDENSKRMKYLNDKLVNGVLNNISNTKLNGDFNNRVCHIANISFGDIEGESLLLLLDMNGICISSGSACNAGSINASYVLSEIGLSDEEAHSSLRFSLSKYTTEEEINTVIEKLIELVDKLRNMNPNYNK